jgi:uncharacterized membrane protein (UPF0127 family)
MLTRRHITIIDETKGSVVGWNIDVASTCFARLVGLLGRAGLEPGTGLLIVPSSGVHTWGMRFPIDVVALDRSLRVLGTWQRLGGFRIAALGWKTHAVLELPAGTIQQSNIGVHDQLAVAH